MFDICATTTDAGPVLRLSGEVDIAAAPLLREAGRRTLAAADTLTVDLAAVSFADAAALGALVGLHNAAAGAGKTLRLRAVPTRVANLLEMTGLRPILVSGELARVADEATCRRARAG